MTYRHRVLYADTDLAGVVYHGTYVRLFEAARTELLHAGGCHVAALQERDGIVFVVSELGLKYVAPARYGDELAIEVRCRELRRASLTLEYQVKRALGGPVCATGHTTIAALALATGKVVRLPATLVAAVRGWEGA